MRNSPLQRGELLRVAPEGTEKKTCNRTACMIGIFVVCSSRLKFAKLNTAAQQREAVTRGRSLLPYRLRYILFQSGGKLAITLLIDKKGNLQPCEIYRLRITIHGNLLL
jgi:hypothetical protein